RQFIDAELPTSARRLATVLAAVAAEDSAYSLTRTPEELENVGSACYMLAANVAPSLKNFTAITRRFSAQDRRNIGSTLADVTYAYLGEQAENANAPRQRRTTSRLVDPTVQQLGARLVVVGMYARAVAFLCESALRFSQRGETEQLRRDAVQRLVTNFGLTLPESYDVRTALADAFVPLYALRLVQFLSMLNVDANLMRNVFFAGFRKTCTYRREQASAAPPSQRPPRAETPTSPTPTGEAPLEAEEEEEDKAFIEKMAKLTQPTSQPETPGE